MALTAAMRSFEERRLTRAPNRTSFEVVRGIPCTTRAGERAWVGLRAYIEGLSRLNLGPVGLGLSGNFAARGGWGCVGPPRDGVGGWLLVFWEDFGGYLLMIFVDLALLALSLAPP